MAKQELTGITQEGVDELREDFKDSNAAEWYDFEERYCLRQIAYQPEDYEGPPRFCQKVALGSKQRYRCDIHKNWGEPRSAEFLDKHKLGATKHGMHSTNEHLKEVLTEDERALYEEVLSWAEHYYIDKEEDPSVWDDLEMLAVERVRVYRTSKWMLDEGETREKPIFDAEGNLVDMEDAPNAISEEHRRLKNMVMGLKKELGLTRKERMKQDGMNDISESAEGLSDAMRELVNDSDDEYNPDDYEYDTETEENEPG